MAQIDNGLRNNKGNHLGFCFIAVLVWIVLEYGRPGNPFKLPLIISILLFLNWLVLPVKKWNPQIVCFFLIIGEMLLHTPFAENTYSAFWTSYGMIVILVCICIPLIHFVDSLRKITVLINTYLLVFLFVGTFAVFNGGMGPAGNWGGQDENYTAAMMCMAMPLGYFSIYFSKSSFTKILRIGSLGVYAAAIVVGFSRGGFVGMVVVYLYCLLKSPKKLMGMILGVLALVLVLTLASSEYWRDMSTITDTQEATVDLRLEAWSIAFRMFQDNPIFGVGPGNFVWNAQTYQSIEQTEKFGRQLFLLTHSMFFELLSEMGLVGVILFGAVIYHNFKDIKVIKTRLRKEKEEYLKKSGPLSSEYRVCSDECDRMLCYANAVVGSMWAYFATFAFLSGFYMSYFWVITAMLVSLKAIVLRRMNNEVEVRPIVGEKIALRRAV